MSAASFSRIWVVPPAKSGKDMPDWIASGMSSGEIADDGSFEIMTPAGAVTAIPGNTVFEYEGEIYACAPKDVQKTIAEAAGVDNEVAVDLKARQDGWAEQDERRAIAKREEPIAKAAGDKPLRLKPIVGAPPSPQFLGIDQLLVDDTYQREIGGGSSQRLIVRIAENWDWRLCLPLLVSRRANKFFVIDGQHRHEGARLRGDIQHLPVVVFDFADPKEEAELFIEANRSRRAMSKLDDHHAAVVAGDNKAIAIDDVVTEAGLRIGRILAWQHWKPGEIVFIASIKRALNSKGGRQLAIQALGIIARAFDGQVLKGAGTIFEGLCAVIRARADGDAPIDPELMELVLSQTGLDGWKSAVEGADSGVERVDLIMKALNAAYAEAEAE